MARTARTITPGAVYHVISRCIEHRFFIDTQKQRSLYLRLLGHALALSDWTCLAYAVMSNHIHLAMVAGEHPLDSWSRRINSPFADAVNQDADRIGPVFVRGPRCSEVAPERVALLLAYIHNNPVRAGVVTTAAESSWTSHRAYVGLDTQPAWLHTDLGLGRARLASAEQLSRFSDTGAKAKLHISLQEIRRAARKLGAIEVGTPTVGDSSSVPLVCRPWARIQTDPSAIFELVAARCNVPIALLRSPARTPAAVQAKRVVVQLAHEWGVVGSAIADGLGISQQAVSKLRHRPLRHEERRLANELKDKHFPLLQRLTVAGDTTDELGESREE